MLGRDLWLRCPEWRALSPAARDVYAMLKAKYNGSNNGEIKLFYSELRGLSGLRCNKTISSAFRELEKGAWIGRTVLGGLYRKIWVYKLTGKFDAHL